MTTPGPNAPGSNASGMPGRVPASLSLRLVAAALVWLTVALAIGGAVLAQAFRNTVEQEFSHRLDAMLRALIAATEIAPDGKVEVVRTLGDPRFEQVFSGWYWQATDPGGSQVRSRSLWDSVIASADGGTGPQIRQVSGPNGEALLVVERDLTFPDAKGPVHMLVAGDLREVRDGVRRFDLLLAVSLGLLGLGMAVAVMIQVRYGLRPLRSMADDLRAVREGRQPRLTGRYPPEVSPLAEAMNGILDKDEDLIERARTHVGNLAHGLKTSLAILAAESEDTTDKAAIRDQVRIMRRLIEHHLGRASAVAGSGRVLGVAVPVRAVAQGIAHALSRVFADKNIEFEIDIQPALAFHGHREDLEEMLGNLMENACKWAKSRVRVTARDAGKQLLLSIEDDGPGMPPSLGDEAARRGRRLDEKMPGWGLGLSIVSDLVSLSGGEMIFARSTLGGLSVSLHIPR